MGTLLIGYGFIGLVAILTIACIYLIAQVNKEYERAVAAEKDRDEAREAARHARQHRDEANAERDQVIIKNRQLAEQVRRMSER